MENPGMRLYMIQPYARLGVIQEVFLQKVLLELSFRKDQRSWQGREYWGSCEEVMDGRRGVTGRWGRASRGGAAGSLQLGLEHSGGHQSCINILLVAVV